MGPFRFCAYFAATGEPLRHSLDDGSWEASAARLEPASPPPRRSPASSSSLPPQSVWGRQATPQHPRSRPPSAGQEPFNFADAAFPPLPRASTPLPSRRPLPAVPAEGPRRGGFGALPARSPRVVSPHRNDVIGVAQTAFFNATQPSQPGEEPFGEPVQGRRPPRSTRHRPDSATLSMEDRFDKMLSALEQLRRQNEQLQQQLSAVLEENARLRQLLPGLSLPTVVAAAPSGDSPPMVPTASDAVSTSSSAQDVKRARLSGGSPSHDV